MTHLLAKLGPVVDARHRVVFARGREQAVEVGEQVLGLPDGAVVVLHGTAPPWPRADQIAPRPWPAELGPFDALRANRQGTEDIDLQDVLFLHGANHLDPRGVPFEFGRARENRTVLNYAGWRLGDFPNGRIRVIVSSGANGTVLIVPPASVPAPRPGPPPQDRPAPPPMPRLIPRPAPRRAAPIPFDIPLRFTDLHFADGALSFLVHGRRVTVRHAPARAIHHAVRGHLDAEQPAGLRATGALLPDGTSTATLTGLDSLVRLFTELQQQTFVHRSVASSDWQEAEALAQAMPSGAGTCDPAALIAVKEFRLHKRAEAFRRLFAHRDRSARVLILPGRAVIIPLATAGARLYAWETVTSDFATYFFQPGDAAAVRRMLDWTRDPEHRRRHLLGDRELQQELGFVARVIHRGDASDLAEWWQSVCGVAGLRDVGGA